MIDSSEQCKCLLAFELQNWLVYEKRSDIIPMTYQIMNFHLILFCCERHDFYVAIATVIFFMCKDNMLLSCVQICSLRKQSFPVTPHDLSRFARRDICSL